MTKTENLFHEQRRHWDGREFDEYIITTEGVGVYGETPEEHLCRMETLHELMMTALDAGAEDFNEEEDSFEILTAPDDFSAVREALEKAGIPMVEAQVAMVPQTYVDLTDEKDVKNLQRTLDLLDEDDDVTDVWTNWNE